MATTGKSRETPRSKAIEISRRIKSGQRELFEFLNPLQDMVALQELRVQAAPADVRINLISRFDDVLREDFPKRAAQHEIKIAEYIGLTLTSTCDEYSSVSLGDPVLDDKGDGWHTVEMPIVKSDHDFDAERNALTTVIDAALGQQGSQWYPESPRLQVVEFRADPSAAVQILEFVAGLAPRETEVFEASVRFRSPVV